MIHTALEFDLEQLRRRRNDLEEQGYIFIEDALPTDYCEDIVAFIDRHLDEEQGEFESGFSGSMQRIWGAERHAGVLQDYKDKCSVILSALFGHSLVPKKILAMRDQRVEFKSQAAQDSFAKGRWHYDSWNDQYKIFLFLRDVGPDNGPFEFIPGTNGSFKTQLLLTRPWWLFNPLTHFTTEKRPYQSISDERVQQIIDAGHPTLPLLARQGSMLIVNPSALLHRASPIRAGRRYLSVAYF